MRIVVDCNVVISASITDGVCVRVIQEVIRSHELILSAPILEEYETVSQRSRFTRYAKRLSGVIERMKAASYSAKPVALSLELPDPDDLVYLQTAVAANADLLITGNIKDFPKACHGVQILTPRDFLVLLGDVV